MNISTGALGGVIGGALGAAVDGALLALIDSEPDPARRRSLAATALDALQR